MDLYLILGAIGAIAAFLVTPWGMPLAAAAFSALRGSKLLQWLVVGAGILIAIATMQRNARKQGEKEALRNVDAANRKAQDRRVEIDVKTGRDTEQTIRDELRRMSK